MPRRKSLRAPKESAALLCRRKSRARHPLFFIISETEKKNNPGFTGISGR